MLHDKLIKIGAKVIRRSRYVLFQLAKVAGLQTLLSGNPYNLTPVIESVDAR